jgi:murein L,D-transpeptidase YafK
MMKPQRTPRTIKILSPIFMVLFSGFVLHQWTLPTEGRSKKTILKSQQLVPDSLLKWPEINAQYAVFVDKAAQKVLVYHVDNLVTPVKVYPCSTGENGGAKSKQNDKRTPEGVYFFTNRFLENELSPIYGVRAFPLDYPNPMDKKEGRGGYGIWFHGLDKPLKPNDTNGCVALNNADIEDMSRYIKLYDTPVIINSETRLVHPDDLKKASKDLEDFIESWRRSWESKQIKKYMSHYSNRFSSKGKGLNAWRKYKTRLAGQYKRIQVQIHNLRILRSNGFVLAKFNQTYTTENFRSVGVKRLYLVRNSRDWKILGEFFKDEKVKRAEAKKARLAALKKAPTKKKPLKKPSAERPDISSLKKIKNFIYFWRDAWQKKNLEAYMSCYDRGFKSRKMDRRAWRRHRARLNKKYDAMKVEISDMLIVQDSAGSARVSFKQDYQADEYRDFGLKKMRLIRRGDNWKIEEETWEPLKKRADG